VLELHLSQENFDLADSTYPGGYVVTAEKVVTDAYTAAERTFQWIISARWNASVSGAMRWHESQEYPLYHTVGVRDYQ
jgi:hypothetical protein